MHIKTRGLRLESARVFRWLSEARGPLWQPLQLHNAFGGRSKRRGARAVQ